MSLFSAELLIVARSVRKAGDDDRALRRAADRGELVRVRRGVFVERSTWEAMDAAERWFARAHAFAVTAASPPVFTHSSAAMLLGIPLLTPSDSLHVARSSGSGTRAGGDVRARLVQVDGTETVAAGGLLCTSPPRTVVDLAVELPFSGAVVSADASLSSGLVTMAELREQAETVGRAPRKVSRALDFASPLADSPGESLSRVLIHQLGFPAPELQHRFHDLRGLIGRVDFWWPQYSVIGEFDGRIKYRAGQFSGTPDEILWNEKLREDRLRTRARTLTRWIWSTLQTPGALAAQLTTAGLPRSR